MNPTEPFNKCSDSEFSRGSEECGQPPSHGRQGRLEQPGLMGTEGFSWFLQRLLSVGQLAATECGQKSG